MKKVVRNDLAGKRFGYLTVIEEIEHRVFSSGSTQRQYKCLCDCGKEVIVTRPHLITGHTKSCGCLKGKMCTEANFKHGQAGGRLYNIYYKIRHRCFNPESKEYHRYGGRGITICEEWLGENGFVNFYNWAINNGYKDDLTIDRINNDGNYEPNNCRWATATEQMNNVNYNVRITYNNETHTIAEWSRLLGIKQSTIQARLKYYNFDDVDALFKPPTCEKPIELFKNNESVGVFKSQKDAANYIGVHTSEMSAFLNGRLRSMRGYTAKRVQPSPNQYAVKFPLDKVTDI